MKPFLEGLAVCASYSPVEGVAPCSGARAPWERPVSFPDLCGQCSGLRDLQARKLSGIGRDGCGGQGLTVVGIARRALEEGRAGSWACPCLCPFPTRAAT